MTEHRLKNPGGDRHDEFDRELNLRAIVYTGAGLAALAAVSFVLMWFLFKGLASYEERRDPRPSPMPEAARPLRPSGTTLQATPERDLADLLRLEHERLDGYGLAEDGEHARIPIERAMEMALARGLGTPEGEARETGAVLEGEADAEDAEGSRAAEAEPTEGEADETPGTTTPATPEGPDGE